MEGVIMFLRKKLPVNDSKLEALRYQPSFELRKNIATVVAYYTLAAVQKGITLDLFVSSETPNYFHGNVSCFMVILSQLLKHGIESLDDQGDICIRISDDSLHQSNSCETELSIIITIHNPIKPDHFSGVNRFSRLTVSANGNIQLNGDIGLQRIKHLCNYFDGNFSMQKLDDRKTQYLVSFVLHQAHPVRMLNLV
jgi:hypothetical protein